MGRTGFIRPVPAGMSDPVVEKSCVGRIALQAETAEKVSAPVMAGHKLGELIWRDGEEIIARVPLLSETDVPKIGFAEILRKLLKRRCSVEKTV